MFKSLFGRQGEVLDDEDRKSGEVWDLPDMEAAGPESRPEPRGGPHFRYEEVSLHPEGVFTADLVGCSPLEGNRAAWYFRTRTDSDYQPHDAEPLPYVTGTTCRPDNKLALLMEALGSVSDGASAPALDIPTSHAALRERMEGLNPESLLGRECRVRVEHRRDELGDATACIVAVAPVGRM